MSIWKMSDSKQPTYEAKLVSVRTRDGSLYPADDLRTKFIGEKGNIDFSEPIGMMYFDIYKLEPAPGDIAWDEHNIKIGPVISAAELDNKLHIETLISLYEFEIIQSDEEADAQVFFAEFCRSKKATIDGFMQQYEKKLERASKYLHESELADKGTKLWHRAINHINALLDGCSDQEDREYIYKYLEDFKKKGIFPDSTGVIICK